MKSYQQFFAEMKRRKVFRVMAAYGVIGFGVIEASGEIFPRVGIPDWAVTLVVWLVLLGFPIAVILAWAFESSPDGMKRTADATDEEIAEIIAQPAARRWMPGLLALAGVALLFGGLWVGRRTAGPNLNLAVSEALAADFTRIAVLPFEDLGGGEEGDPLVAGMAIQVREKLGSLASLRVTSTSSVRDYAGTDKTIREIAAELGDVDHVLRGSVGRSGNHALVNVWLVDVATNEDIWARSWDKEITAQNLFEVQRQIAREVADRLEAKLSPAEIEQLEAGQSTDDLEAINLYYRAQNALDFRQKDETWRDALAYAERAVERAPEYVEAWALIAQLRAWAERMGESTDGTTLAAIERVESLAPGSPWALRARTYPVIIVERDPVRALELMEEAWQLAPSDADILTSIAVLRYQLGDFEEGLSTMRRAVQLDPRNQDRLFRLAVMLSGMTRWEAADAVTERMLAIDPDDQVAKLMKVGLTDAITRDPARARRAAAELGIDPQLSLVAYNMAFIALEERDFDEAAELWSRVGITEALSVATASRLSERARIEVLRGGNPTPYEDSLIAIVDSVPVIEQDFQTLAAVSRFLAGDAEGGLTLLRDYLAQAAQSADVTRLTRASSDAAEVYARFGYTEEALAALDRSVARPYSYGNSYPLGNLEHLPIWDPLRGDPRFDDILARQEAWEAEQARLAEEQGPWLP